MNWVARHWTRFWFEPTRPTNLGVTRVLFFGFVLYHFRSAEFRLWGDVPSVFWMPVSFFRTLGIEPFSVGALEVLTAVWVVSLAASCVGLFTRPAVPVAFFTSLYLLGLPQSFGKVHHSDALLVLLMGAFAFARCGDAWSVDALLRRARRRWRTAKARVPADPEAEIGREAGAPEASPEYTWPLRLAWVLFALVFFAAGVAKVRTSGLEWIFSDNMAVSLLRHHYTHHPHTDIGLALAEIAWIPPLIAAGTILVELAAPLALFSRTARWVVIPGLFFMQLGIWILLGVSFRRMFPAYLIWIPYAELGGAAARLEVRATLAATGERVRALASWSPGG